MNAIEFAATARPNMDIDQLVDWATIDVPGNPLEAIRLLIDGVLARYADRMDDAAVAALQAVAEHHAPMMWELVEDLTADLDAARKANHAA